MNRSVVAAKCCRLPSSPENFRPNSFMNISGTIPELEVIMIFINMLLLTRGQFFIYLHEYERALYADVHLQYQALM